MTRTWQISLGERIDPALPGPLYRQIIEGVIRDIESGRLAAGAYMPSSRELASVLGVNRKTVVLAYEDLIAQGWLVTSATRGTMVAATLPEAVQRKVSAVGPVPGTVQASYAFQPPPERPLTLPGHLGPKIDEGSPDGRLFPADLLARANRQAVMSLSRSNGFLYRDPRGTLQLREAIAGMLKAQRGLQIDAGNVCITRGSQNGIFLAALGLLRAGDSVIVEALTYEPAVAAFRAIGARIIPVSLDADGMDVAEVERVCRKQAVNAVFVTPHHQFPTTVALRPDRRLQLIELSRQYGFAIIEDDYDHEFHFESQPLLPLAAYAPGEVIYVGSLSKLLLPSLRIGYVAAPVRVIEAMAHLVALTDGMGNSATELSAATLIGNGKLRRHARKARQVYAARRESFARALTETLGSRAHFRLPAGGLAFWVQFAGDMDAIEARAAASGLRFASSRSYMTSDRAPRGLRLGFASLNETEAAAAVAALARAAA